MRTTLKLALLSLLPTGCAGEPDATVADSAVREEGLMCLYQAEEGELCSLDDLGSGEQEDLLEGGCWITGGGHIGDADNHPGAGRAHQDSFGFNAMGMKSGEVRGELQDTTHLGDVFHGHATWIRCWKDEGLGPEVPHAIPNNAEWGGTGSWNHQDGYTWKAHLADRAEGGHHADEYEIWVYDATATLVYTESEIIDGGNFQIHPPNTGHPYIAGDAP